jgi:hypothetical protein
MSLEEWEVESMVDKHPGECTHPGALLCERAGAHLTDDSEKVGYAVDLFLDSYAVAGQGREHEACPFTLKATSDEIAGHILVWLFTGDTICGWPQGTTIRDHTGRIWDDWRCAVCGHDQTSHDAFGGKEAFCRVASGGGCDCKVYISPEQAQYAAERMIGLAFPGIERGADGRIKCEHHRGRASTCRGTA